MPDTRWILPQLEYLLGRFIPNYPVDWVGVRGEEIVMVGFRPKTTKPKP